MPFLMLGEALVDLVCEQPADGLTDAPSFAPHFGGAAANVAVSAARALGRAALAGGAGRDPWGQWLLERLRGEAVDTRFFALGHGRQTPIAFATVTAQGEPSFSICPLRARERALELGRPVVLRPEPAARALAREQEAVDAARACLPGCRLVKANAAEGRLLTGEADPAAEAGARATETWGAVA